MSNRLGDLFKILRPSQNIWTLSPANAADLPNRATSRAETGKKSGNCVPLPFPKSYSGQGIPSLRNWPTLTRISDIQSDFFTIFQIFSRFFMFLKLKSTFWLFYNSDYDIWFFNNMYVDNPHIVVESGTRKIRRNS